MDFNKLDLSKYQIRFNQKIYNQLNILKQTDIKYVISFHFLGMIDLDKNIYYWANIIPGVNKNFTKFIKNIKKLNNKFEDMSDINNQIYYQILSEDIISLNKKVNPEFLKEFLSDLLDKQIILLNNSNGKFQVIAVDKILEKY